MLFFHQISGTAITEVQGPIPAADAIVSFYPEFQGFGEFITTGNN